MRPVSSVWYCRTFNTAGYSPNSIQNHRCRIELAQNQPVGTILSSSDWSESNVVDHDCGLPQGSSFGPLKFTVCTLQRCRKLSPAVEYHFMGLLTTRNSVNTCWSTRSMQGSPQWLTASLTLNCGAAATVLSWTLTSQTLSGLAPDNKQLAKMSEADKDLPRPSDILRVSETVRNLGVNCIYMQRVKLLTEITSVELFKTYCIPCLTCACEALQFTKTDINKLDNLIARALYRIFKVHDRENIDHLRQCLNIGLPSLHVTVNRGLWTNWLD